MAYRVVQNLLFYNPKANENDVRLELATRKFIGNPNDTKPLGYQLVDSHVNKYVATDVNGYCSMLIQSLLDSEKQNRNFELSVEPITYSEQKAKCHAFLYLADTLCSIYSNLMQHTNGHPTHL